VPVIQSSTKFQQKAPVSRCKGFNLLELMIALSVSAILLLTASPSIRQFRANNQITTATNSIITALNLARFNAVTRGEEVEICPYDPQDTIKCTDENWHRGWIVFRQNGATDSSVSIPDEAVIRVGILPGAFENVSPLKPELDNKTSIVFKADGTTASATILPIDVYYNDTSYTDRHMQITISPFGPISSCIVGITCSG
jgi:prepilin-type N-terminal cleavage/methylation domain-containing protein